MEPPPPPPPNPLPPIAGRSSQPVDSVEDSQPLSARSGRSPSFSEQPSSARFSSLGRPSLKVRTVPAVPPSVPLSVKPQVSATPADAQPERVRDKRYLSPFICIACYLIRFLFTV